jgi:hypothetical protein
MLTDWLNPKARLQFKLKEAFYATVLAIYCNPNFVLIPFSFGCSRDL